MAEGAAGGKTEPRSDEYNFGTHSFLSDELYCLFDQLDVAVAGATIAANTRRKEAVTASFFSASSPDSINPTASTHGHFILSPVSFA